MKSLSCLLLPLLLMACSPRPYYAFKSQGVYAYDDNRRTTNNTSEFYASAGPGQMVAEPPRSLVHIQPSPEQKKASAQVKRERKSIAHVLAGNLKAKPREHKGDSTKNIYAKLGLGASITGYTVAVIAFGAEAYELLTFAGILFLGAIVLSIIGLRSKKRRMSKVGLSLGISGLGALVIFTLLILWLSSLDWGRDLEFSS